MTKFPLVPCLQSSISTLSFSFLALLFCYAVSSCVYDHNHPYLVSERLFLAENKAFRTCGELWRTRRRALAILCFEYSGDLTCGHFCGRRGEAKKPRQKISSLRLGTGPSITVPISVGNFERALRRHFSVEFQTQFIIGKILSWSKRAYFVLWIGRGTNERRPFEVCRRVNFAFDRRRRPLYNSLTGYPKYETNTLLWRH